MLFFKIKNAKGITSAVITVKEIESIVLSKDKEPCIDYNAKPKRAHEIFIDCCKENLMTNFVQNVKCSIPALNTILPSNTTITECANEDDALKVFRDFYNLTSRFVEQPSKYGCPVPCTQVTFKVYLEYFHKNTWKAPDNGLEQDFFSMIYFYSTLSVEEKIENLDFDLGSLLASAGGNLGLVLGLSCLPVLLSIIRCLKTIFLDKIFISHVAK